MKYTYFRILPRHLFQRAKRVSQSSLSFLRFCFGYTSLISFSLLYSAGVDTARKILKIYEQLVTFSDNFGSDEDGMLLAGFCEFKPGSGRRCEGGVMDGLSAQRELVLAQEMEDTFITLDASGLLITPAHRFLQKCATQFSVSLIPIQICLQHLPYCQL